MTDHQQQLGERTDGMWFHLQHARWRMPANALRDDIDDWIYAMVYVGVALAPLWLPLLIWDVMT